MTKEQAAYADTLNLLGSSVPDPVEDVVLVTTLAGERYAALHPDEPHVHCPHCWWTTPYGGAVDGEHFLALWEHLITRHEVDVWLATAPARDAWDRAVAEYEGVKAA